MRARIDAARALVSGGQRKVIDHAETNSCR